MVAKEKHGERIIEADDVNEAALKLLTERFEAGYWYHDPFQERHPFSLELRKKRDALLALNVDDLPDDVKRARKRAEEDRDADDRQHDEYVAIEDAVRDRDGKAAWRILQARRDHEYEWVELMETS